MRQQKKTAIIALSVGGRELAERIAPLINAEVVASGGQIKKTLARIWRDYRAFVLIMACGVAVRAIAPLIRDKKSDPAVVVMDQEGRFAISLLSGHLGGANGLARRVAAVCGAEAVITTASDLTGHTALDLWLRDHGLYAPDETVTRASAVLVNRGRLAVCDRIGYPLPEDFFSTPDPDSADLVISDRDEWKEKQARPLPLYLGVGCNRGTPAEEIEAASAEFFAATGLARLAVAGVASIDLKKDEPGLAAFAEKNRWPLLFFSSEELNRVPVAMPSAAVMRATGAAGVAEPAAVLAAGNGELIAGKRKWKNVTMAAACSASSAPDRATKSN